MDYEKIINLKIIMTANNDYDVCQIEHALFMYMQNLNEVISGPLLYDL